MKKNFIIASLLISSLAYADVKSTQIDELTDSIKSICDAPSEGTSSHYKITAQGDSILRIKFLGKIGGEADFEKEEWEGVQRVLREDLAGDKQNYRECVRELVPIFIKNFVKEEATISEPQQKEKSQDQKNMMPQMSCNDVESGTEESVKNKIKLIELAGVTDSNRNHENAVYLLCTGDFDGANFWVNGGYVDAKYMDELARILGINFQSKLRSEQGLRYNHARKRFLDLGLCHACASNIAHFYSEEPSSYCGKLAQRALDGDEEALGKLQDSTDPTSNACTR